MGVRVLPEHAQSCIMSILKTLNLEGYIDDCGLWSNDSFNKHLELLD